MNTWKFRSAAKACATITCFVLAAFTLTACGDDNEAQEPAGGDEQKEMSLLETIRSKAELSRFMEALKESGYDQMLSEGSEWTVLALDNEGMQTYLDSMTAETYSTVAKRHILNQALTAEKMANDSTELKNLLGERVTVVREDKGYKISIDFGNAYFETATIKVANRQCTNGLLNILSDISFTVAPQQERVVEENLWYNKEDLMNILTLCYLKFAQFEESQLTIEGFRINERSVHSLNAHSRQLEETYTAAYQTINNLNRVIISAPQVVEHDARFSEEEMRSVVAQAKCIRAFVYYNLAMLWGDVIFYTDLSVLENVGFDLPPQVPQAEVFRFAYDEICEALDDLPPLSQTEGDSINLFIRPTALMQKAELALTLGNYEAAKNALSDFNQNFCFWIYKQYGEILPLYTPELQALFRKEAEGDTEGLAEEWTELIKTSEQTRLKEACYGYWAALKRLGKAQEVTGCYDYELLMPFSANEVMMNPQVRQNPGY